MKLKLYSRNSARPALIFSLLLACLFLTGCQDSLEPTYRQKDIPDIVKKICKEEYGLDVTTKTSPNTLMIYAPVDKFLHKDYGIKDDKVFDEEIADKLRNILTTIGRVIISSDNTPEFFALVMSDIKQGLDYIIIGYVLDLKKSYAEFIPWTEANRRYVIHFGSNPEAIGDTTGQHIPAFDVSLPDFLAVQMGQRLGSFFHEERIKKYFKVNKSEGQFLNDTFRIEYSIEQVAEPPEKIDIEKEALQIIAYCIRAYEFKDFSGVELNDLVKEEKFELSRSALMEIPIE